MLTKHIATLVVAAFALAGFSAHAANNPPQISGTPATEATVGVLYVFQPGASDPDGGRLRFKISGKPPWAAFSAATGKLSGTPLAGHVGTYRDIRITVTDGRLSASLAPFTDSPERSGMR